MDKKITVTFDILVTDEKDLRDHFRESFLPHKDADKCDLGYFALCAVEDAILPLPGVLMASGSVDYKEETVPEELGFHIKCPECTTELETLMVNDGEKIVSKPVSCTCGWSRGEMEVSDLEILDEDEN